mmetsp:Transcript_147957/g.412122  ORF Transcript_147957/g.412122 Transcript_147957/m.412122 type:complete len:320 (+) Transcript_147957:59-1018(+)
MLSSPSGKSTVTEEGLGLAEAEEMTHDPPGAEERTKRPGVGGGGTASKRPRYDGKPFGELTVNDLEHIVKEVGDLKKQLAAGDEEVARLKDALASKGGVAKQVKQLEADLVASQKDAAKYQAAVREQDEEITVQAERVKKALRQQLTGQMVFTSAWREQLQDKGRDIVAFAPNINPAVLKALGAEPGSKVKHADHFFEAMITRSAANGGIRLALARNLTFKYIKSTCELRVDALYRIQPEEKKSQANKKQAKKAAKKKSTRRGSGAAEGGTEDGAEGAEGEEEGDGEEGEEGEDAEEDEAEAGAGDGASEATAAVTASA